MSSEKSVVLGYAKELRKQMTKEERHLWYDFLRNHTMKFYKQKIIGNYIVDFYCHKAKLVIELDGSQHYEEDGIAYDEKRTEVLKQQGLRVIRFSNLEVRKNFEGVCQMIDLVIQEQTGDSPLSQLR